MGIFSQNFNRPGPGVPKDAPKKKGVARYFEMLFRDFSTLWKSSMLLTICMIPMLVVGFLLFAPLFDYFISGNPASLLPLPMILILILLIGVCGMLLGPALCACHTVILKIVRDEPGFFWHDFKKGWRSCWKQSYLISAGFSMVIAMDFVSLCLFFGGSIREGQADGVTGTLLLGCIVLSLVIFFGVWFTVCLQIVFMNIPTVGMLKNGLLLLFGRLPRMLPATLLNIVFLIACFLWMPLAPIVLLIGVPALIMLWTDMLAWPVMDEVFKLEEQLTALREKELSQNQSSDT